MRVLVLFFIIATTSVCSFQSQTTIANDTSRAFVESPSPTPDNDYLKVPTKDTRPLNKKQKKELDSTLPPKVREVLEKAEKLEVLGLSSEEKTGIGWYPDMKATLSLSAVRTELLASFFYDASAGPNPSACFIPRHGLKATYKGKTVEVIICYQCHLFTVKGDLGEYDGGVYQDGSAANRLFESLMKTKGEPIK